MKKSILCQAVLIAGLLPSGRLLAIDQTVLNEQFSLPDRPRNLVGAHDEYYNAVERLQDADAAVVRAREGAMKELQSTADYAAAVKAVDAAYQAYTEKKNAVVADLGKKNPTYTEMKTQCTAADARIETARQNSATTQEQFEELYKNRGTFEHQWQQLETDAMDRAGLAPLRQAWVDASKKLSDLQDKQRLDVEATEKLKGALVEVENARSAVDQARRAINGSPAEVDPANSEQVRAGDLLCKVSRPGIAGNDAWWTYGWTNLPAAKTPAGGSK